MYSQFIMRYPLHRVIGSQIWPAAPSCVGQMVDINISCWEEGLIVNCHFCQDCFRGETKVERNLMYLAITYKYFGPESMVEYSGWKFLYARSS